MPANARRDAGIVGAEVGMDTRISKSEQQRRARQRALSIAQFSENYGIGRTKTYQEVKSGRLRARKVGRRTIITEEDAEAWLTRLPAVPASEAAT
jgi:excisionase family DNA binding protein